MERHGAPMRATLGALCSLVLIGVVAACSNTGGANKPQKAAAESSAADGMSERARSARAVSTGVDPDAPPLPPPSKFVPRSEAEALASVAAETAVAAEIDTPTETDAQAETEIAALPPEKPVRESPARPAPSTEVDGDPEQLMGLDGTALHNLLGPPRLRRVEGPAEVWQYATPDCVLDAYLYESAAGAADHNVTYYEVRGPAEGTTADGERCFADLVTAWRVAQGNQ